MEKSIFQYYKGFTLDQAVGNNAFSYSQRLNKSIDVPSLVEGSLDDLCVGNTIVFSEVSSKGEENMVGLKNFLYLNVDDKPVFIFDNHNHAFFFWCYAFSNKQFKNTEHLVHVDQHKDMRKPKEWIDSQDIVDLDKVFQYTNEVLNVGNFIQPALKAKVFLDVQMIDNENSFDDPLPEKYVLDIDIDIFSEDMRYIDESMKISRIKEYMKGASLITIATSPYFMDQNRAIDFIKELFL